MTSVEIEPNHRDDQALERPTAVVLRPDRVEHYKGPLGLEPLQGLVGGLIEVFETAVAGMPPASVYLNEEGKFLGLPANRLGTILLQGSGGIPGDVVAGTVVLTGVPDVYGETQPVPLDWISYFPERQLEP